MGGVIVVIVVVVVVVVVVVAAVVVVVAVACVVVVVGGGGAAAAAEDEHKRDVADDDTGRTDDSCPSVAFDLSCGHCRVALVLASEGLEKGNPSPHANIGTFSPGGVVGYEKC